MSHHETGGMSKRNPLGPAHASVILKEMKRLLIYAVTLLAGTFVGVVAWGLAEARLGLGVLDVALVFGLLWLAQRFPKPQFTGGRAARVLYVVAGFALLFSVAALFLLPVYGHQLPDCGPARIGICEPAGPTLNTTRFWTASAGFTVAFVMLLAGLMVSAHDRIRRQGHRWWTFALTLMKPATRSVDVAWFVIG